MTFELRLRAEAEFDLAEAALWYEEQAAGLGGQFLDETLAAFVSITEMPLACQVIYRNTRRFLIHRFPFGIYYRVEENTIVVVAIMHGSRNPLRWKGRR
jgi:plasmid stabilization system protein ParE